MAPPRNLRKVQREDDAGIEEEEPTSLKREVTKVQQPKANKSSIKLEFKDLDLTHPNNDHVNSLDGSMREGMILSLEDLEQQEESFFSALSLDRESFRLDHEQDDETVELDEWEGMLLRKGNYASEKMLHREVLDSEESPLISTDKQLAQLRLAQSQDEASRACSEEKVGHLSSQISQAQHSLADNQEKMDFFEQIKQELEKFFLLIDEKCIDEKIEANVPFEPVCELDEFLKLFLEWHSQYPESFEELGIMQELEVIIGKYFQASNSWREQFKTVNEVERRERKK